MNQAKLCKSKLKGQIRKSFLRLGQVLTVLLFAATTMNAQDLTVRGKVSENSGESLIGVNITVKGGTQGTTSDIDGNYTIKVGATDVLVFSYIGYATQEVAVNGQTTINGLMKMDSEVLEEVVVVGYGSQKKDDLTGAVSVVDVNEAKKTVARIKSDVEDLKIGMQNDYELMMNDLLRILSIYSSLNDKLIPSVKSFIRLTSSVIKSEINPIYNELSNIYGVKELRDENSNLIKEGRLIDVELIDKSDSLNFCKDEEIRLEKMLKMMQFEYDFLLEIKPIKPSSFYKIISFGRSESLFEKVLIDWENSSSPKINQYVKLKKYHDKQENIRVDIKKDVEHLNARKIEVDALVKANSDRILNIYKQSPISVDKIKLLLKNMKIISQEVKNTISVGLLTEDLKVLN